MPVQEVHWKYIAIVTFCIANISQEEELNIIWSHIKEDIPAEVKLKLKWSDELKKIKMNTFQHVDYSHGGRQW